MATYHLCIRRYDPDRDTAWTENHQVDADPRDTVLEGLRQLQAAGSEVAFAYGCRDGRCGLCAVTVDGHPRLSCNTRLKDGQVVEPLTRFPVLRDLVVDRSRATAMLVQAQAYRQGGTSLGVWIEPREHRLLTPCNECLACCGDCPAFDAQTSPFPGPVVFGRLAMFAMQPDDGTNRAATARSAGLEQCLDCSGCRCPQGVPVWSMGVKRLLGA